MADLEPKYESLDDTPKVLDIDNVFNDTNETTSSQTNQSSHSSYAYKYLTDPTMVKNKTLFWFILSGLVLLMFSGIAYGVFQLTKSDNNSDIQGVSAEKSIDIPLEDIANKSKITLNQLSRLDIIGLVNINGILRLSPVEKPTNP